jgi:hypothetical protein
MNKPTVESVVALALNEDIGTGDVSRHHSVATQFECFYLMTKKHFAHIQCRK